MTKDKFFEEVGSYTKYKVVEMLVEKHKDRFKNLDTIEEVADDILNILSICGLKFYGNMKQGRSGFNE